MSTNIGGNGNANYHLKFRHFKPGAKSAVKSMRAGWLALTDEQKAARMLECVKALSLIYGMQAPRIIVVPNHWSGAGMYSPAENLITLVKYSQITLLHEYRHAMQAQLPQIAALAALKDSEEDARGWSQSLYYRVAPVTYRRLCAEGQLYFNIVTDTPRPRIAPVNTPASAPVSEKVR